jgi:hypothetical protein
MKTAMSICGNDLPLAMLTLANFTKNMAAEERRQVSSQCKKNCTEIASARVDNGSQTTYVPKKIDASLKSTYVPEKIDRIFQRIEGFSDSANEKYNKEGALYHFYGAMFAASRWGPVVVEIVDTDNASLRHQKRTDRIKDAAGLAGAKLGLTTCTELPGSFFESWELCFE